ncbi:MAG TPA: LysM domain-containing protein, partial [Anaerolineaceae bacterium]|nr:LysM domain-containing protein [Anaerolineaceae bacterium]
MTDTDKKNEANFSSSELSSKEPTSKQKSEKKLFYKEPAIIGAIALLVLAGILLAIWLIKPKEKETVDISTETPTHDHQATPFVKKDTAVPTATRVTEEPTEVVVVTAEPRTEVITHVIQEGETITEIADKYGIWPDTIIWANRYEQGTNVLEYTAGESIFILPVNGAYHKWFAGEGLNGVAKYYNVSPDDIIDYPGNNLDREKLGSLSNPNILPGT